MMLLHGIIASLLLSSSALALNPFVMHPRPLPKAGSHAGPKPLKAARHAPAQGETPLEQELLSLGAELEEIAAELIKIPADKEVKQILDKKRAERDKKGSTAGKPGAAGGYRPGSYRPSSFGGSSYGRSAGGSSFGRSPSSFGGGGFRGFGGGSGFGSGGLGGLGGLGGSFGSSRGTPSSTPTSSSTSPSAFTSASKGGDSFPAGISGDKTLGSSSGSSRSFVPPKGKKGRDEEEVYAKLTGQLSQYTDRLGKELQQIASATDKTVRAQRIRSLSLNELNRLYEEIFSTRSTLKKEEVTTLEKTPEWKAAMAKLQKLQAQVTPHLIDLMIPLGTNELDKVAEARKTFELLDIGSRFNQQTLQNMVATRCKAVTDSYLKKAHQFALARQRAIRAVAPAQRGAAKIAADQEIAQHKKALADELAKIVEAFPADKLGSPVPRVLTDAVEKLRR